MADMDVENMPPPDENKATKVRAVARGRPVPALRESARERMRRPEMPRNLTRVSSADGRAGVQGKGKGKNGRTIEQIYQKKSQLEHILLCAEQQHDVT